MRILHLMSCRGWSSDAYWAARISRELAARGHEVTLGCRAGTEKHVISRAQAEGVRRIVTFAFAGGIRPRADLADIRRLRAVLRDTDVVHVHRGKEHWVAAIASRLQPASRPIVRSRHIVQAVRPHAGNRWLYRNATALVVTVTEGIRQQYLASGLLAPERVVTLPGGADVEAYRPRPCDLAVRQRLGGADPEVPLFGLVSGLRVMKGHRVVTEAAARLAARGIPVHFAFIGRGTQERAIHEAIEQAGLGAQVTMAGFVPDLPAVMAALDAALYVPLESEGMSRVLFEYLAAGRPVIASRVGVVPEVLVDDRDALLVPAGDPEPLAAAIARLALLPSLRIRLAEAARRLVVERYSGARIAETLEAHYERLVERSRG